MIDTKALRSKVLDLAIQGKLTEQLESDGTAEELFAQIQEEKQRLIKEGKIKKEKPLPPVADEEIPFEIPRNWHLCSFNSINFYISETTTPLNNPTTLYELYSVPNFPLNTPEILKGENIGSAKQLLQENDILVCKINPRINRVWRVSRHTSYTLIGSSEWIPFRNNRVSPSYMCYYFQSAFFRIFMLSNLSGVGGSLTRAKPEFVKNYPIILPPLAEQKRIVERVEEIFKLLDIIDEAQAKYSADAETLKSKLITMGIQGKLTEQLESDGTAEELFAQIQEEKQRLIKEGKIKKEKPLPPVSDEEIPFEIPSSWKWVRFGELMRNRDSERVPVSVEDRKKLAKKYDYYGASGIIDKVETYLFDKTLLLIGEDGANLLSRSTPIAFLAEGKYWVNNHAHVLDTYVGDYHIFVMHYINSISLVPYVTGSAQPKLNQENMSKIPVPLPSLAEQKRIADKLDEILRVIG